MGKVQDYLEKSEKVMFNYGLPKQQKTEKIVDENKNLIVELDYIDFLQFKIKLMQIGYEGGYYYLNEHGGIDEIDKYGNSDTYYPFKCVTKLLHELIKEQVNVR